MSHKHDWWERVRRRIVPLLGYVSLFFEEATGENYYVMSETRDNQFVARVPMGEEEFEECLHEMGFERNPMASLKSHARTEEVEEGSFRKIGYEDHPKYQLHVILYDGNEIPNAKNGHTFVYAHWELRWDVHPIRHYRGENASVKEGVTRMRRLLEDHGAPYDEVQP